MAITIPILTDFDGRGINRAVREFQQLETAGQKASLLVKKAAIPAGVALAALGVAAVGAAKAAIEDDAAQEQLARTLASSTKATKSQIGAIDDYITKTSMAASVSDDELRPALAVLARGTGDLETAQKGLGIALDVAAGSGKPLGQVSEALSKAYAGNLRGLNALDPRMKELVKNGASAEEAIGLLAKTFKGDATASAETAAGRMKGFGIALDETKEAVGSALLPALEKILPVLQKFARWAQENPGVFLAIAGAIGVVAAGIIALNVAMTILAANPVALIIGAIVVAVAGLTIGLIALYKKSETFRDIVSGSWTAIKKAVQIVVDIFDGPLKAAFDVISGVIGALVALVKGDFSGVWDNLKKAAGGVIDWLKETLLKLPIIILGLVIEIGKAIVTGIASGAVGLAEAVWEKIKAFPGALGALVVGWFNDLVSFGGKILQWIASGATGLASLVWEKISGFASALGGFIVGWFTDLASFGGKIVTWIASGVTGLASDIWEKIKNFPSALWNEILNLKDTFVGWGKKLVDWIVEGIKSMGSAIGQALFGWIQSGGSGGDVRKMIGGRDGNPATPFADGGIVTRPTFALIGEAGPEAVIPLNRAGAMGGITINIDAGLVSTPDQIGQQIIEAIQTAQRRSGPVFAPA